MSATMRNALPVPASVAFPASVDLQRLMDAFETVCEANSMSYVHAAGVRAYNGRLPSVNEVRGGTAPRGEPLTFFQSTRLPKLSLFNLGRALRNNFDTTQGLVAAAVVVMIRYCETSGFRPTLHSMHRLFVGALPLTVKAHCDMFMRNSDAARLCGVVVEEINRLEAAICDGVDWKLIVQAEELANIDGLIARVGELTLAPRPLVQVAPLPPLPLQQQDSMSLSCSDRGVSPAKSFGESPSEDYAATSAGVSPAACSSTTPPRSVRNSSSLSLLNNSLGSHDDVTAYWAAQAQANARSL